MVSPSYHGGGGLLVSGDCYVYVHKYQASTDILSPDNASDLPKVRDRVLNDYKFFCFSGEVKCLYVSDSIHHKIQFYDDEFQALDIERYDYTKFETLPTKPEHFEQMKMLARQLSKDIPHVRVDFYEINGRIYFGELTFYTGSGFIPFKDRKWDERLGSWVQLPIATEDKKTTESTKI